MAPPQKPGRSKQDVGTPPDLLVAVCALLGISWFQIDLAATRENAIAPLCYTPEDDALSCAWERLTGIQLGWGWCNPEFGDLEPWTRHAAVCAERGAYAALLTPAAVGSEWWATWVEPYAYALHLRPRVTFVGHKDPYPKDCSVLLYTPMRLTGSRSWRWK